MWKEYLFSLPWRKVIWVFTVMTAFVVVLTTSVAIYFSSNDEISANLISATFADHEICSNQQDIYCMVAANSNMLQAQVSTAKIDFLSTSSIGFLDKLYISGSGFEELGPYSYICFNDDNHCVGQGHDLLISWSPTEIFFKMPVNTQSSGTIYVYTDSGEKTNSVNYITKPTILTVNYMEVPSTQADVGSTVTIQGGYMGNGKGKVTFGILDAEVISWSDNEITVKVPSANVDTKKIIVTRSDGKETAPFEFHILMSATDKTTVFNDELFSLQKYLKAIDFIDTTSGPAKNSVIVAVLDEGVYLNHPELQGKFWNNAKEITGDNRDNDNNGYIDDVNGYNFVSNTNNLNVLGDHGTSVAGIIAATRSNKIGIVGIAQKAKIMPIIICDAEGQCTLDATIKGIKYAVDNGARVINLSLGSNLTNGFTTEYDDVIKYAHDRNVVIIVAAGNGDVENGIGMDLSQIPQSPVCNDGGKNMIIGVAASSLLGDYSTPWTNYGNCVDIWAPGESMISLKAKGQILYEMVDGTSFAAPVVTGVITEILSMYPNMRNYTLTNFLIKNANSSNGVIKMDSLVKDIASTYKDEGRFYAPSPIIISNTVLEPPSEILSGQEKFTDVMPSNTFYAAINYLVDNNIVRGYSDGTYRPEAPINRAEFTKIIIESLNSKGNGIECFSDVHTEWFAPYICYSKTNKIIGGYEDHTFRPNKNINLAEALKVVLLALKVPLSSDKGTNWYDVYINTANQHNLLGYINPDPKHEVTRGEMAQLIYLLKH